MFLKYLQPTVTKVQFNFWGIVQPIESKCDITQLININPNFFENVNSLNCVLNGITFGKTFEIPIGAFSKADRICFQIEPPFDMLIPFLSRIPKKASISLVAAVIKPEEC